MPEDAVSLGEFEIRGRTGKIGLWALDVEAPMTTVDGTERATKIQDALYRIAETAETAEDMHDFYTRIHAIVRELMYADNFYIALYDEERRAINWPYYADEVDEDVPDPTVWEPMGTGEARGVTAYALRRGDHPVAGRRLSEPHRARGDRAHRGRGEDWLGIRCGSRTACSASSSSRPTNRDSTTRRATSRS